MPLNPQVAAMVAAFAEFPAMDVATLTADQLRETDARPIDPGPEIIMERVEDLSLPLPGRTLAARLYVPQGAGETPALTMYFHGGGWVIGTLDTYDATCRALARASGSAMLSVGYRLAPEHRYPAAVDDCYDALCWAQASAAGLGLDPGCLAVAGDSAGGNLSAAVSIVARDRGGPALRHQLLIYPVTDRDFTRPSYLANGGGEYFLSLPMMEWFWNQYLGEMDVSRAPLAAVLNTPDLAGLPPATVLTAEFDPLRDEGMAYAQRLAAAGVPVATEVAPGMIHGFASMFGVIPDALPFLERAGASLGRGLT